MLFVPKLIWPGKIYSEKEMLDIRVDFTTSEDKLQKTEKDPSKAKVKKRKLYNRTGRKFFERYELAIRHHQAVYGNQPVFERFWHFWGFLWSDVDECLGKSTRNLLEPSYPPENLQISLHFPALRGCEIPQ